MKSFVILFLISLSIEAGTYFPTSALNITLKAENLLDKINRVIDAPQDVLEQYAPVGGKVTDKVVNGHTFSFVMTKKVLIITKTFKVYGELQIKNEGVVCAKDEIGLNYAVDLNGSDDLVLDNVKKLDFDICLAMKSSSEANAKVTGKVFKGDRYAEPLGSIARSMIEDQVGPFVKALQSVLSKMN